MAALSDAHRIELWAEFMRDISREREQITVSKADLRAAVDATDDWVEANKVSFNNALPAAAKANLTAAQKARLLSFVVKQRFVKGA